ncbi:TetR/AcrR family transcriptional regulator [Actibacterium sp. D379-3]
MARPRAFDPDTVLTGAMHAFRRQGFARCSVRDLEASSGVTSGSLYNTYGDKQGLFQAACAHYLRTVVDQRIRKHAPKGSGIAGLQALFLSTLNEPDAESYGCLITNSAVEFGDAGAPDVVAEGLEVLKAAFDDRLGGDAADADALLAFYQGVLVLVRAGYDKRMLERMILRFFESLAQTA